MNVAVHFFGNERKDHYRAHMAFESELSEIYTGDLTFNYKLLAHGCPAVARCHPGSSPPPLSPLPLAFVITPISGIIAHAH